MNENSKSTRTVYTTELGRICPDCGQAVARCGCCKTGKSRKKSVGVKSDPAAAKNDGIVRIGRSTKGRRGKGVTTVSGILLSGDDLKEVAQKLKAKCGAGGTEKNGVIEIQGDHRQLLQKMLEKMGYTVKQSGG
ncbi:MAG: stress response translation initiation inhibitor YciH [Pirellulales bacterium]|nr:stress response translation initiation inhibitor YciH [Pirellulales bacterium]